MTPCRGIGISRELNTKARRHKERPQTKVLDAAFLCAFVPLCFNSRLILHNLKRSSDRELEVVGRLVNAERYAGYWPDEVPVDPCRIEHEIEPERRVHNGHYNLEFQAGAHAQAGIRSCQELGRQCLNQSRRDDLALQGILLQYPGITGIHEWDQ